MNEPTGKQGATAKKDANRRGKYPECRLIRTCLPEIDESATHEYDHEPPPEPRKLTPSE